MICTVLNYYFYHLNWKKLQNLCLIPLIVQMFLLVNLLKRQVKNNKILLYIFLSDLYLVRLDWFYIHFNSCLPVAASIIDSNSDSSVLNLVKKVFKFWICWRHAEMSNDGDCIWHETILILLNMQYQIWIDKIDLKFEILFAKEVAWFLASSRFKLVSWFPEGHRIFQADYF